MEIEEILILLENTFGEQLSENTYEETQEIYSKFAEKIVKQIEELKAENEHYKTENNVLKHQVKQNTKLKEGIQNILDRPDVSYCFNTEADLKALLKD